MGRKSRIGRLHKNYEKKRQATNKNCVGRPSKCKNVKQQQSPESALVQTVTVDEFEIMRSIRLPSLWNISYSHDHHIIY